MNRRRAERVLEKMRRRPGGWRFVKVRAVLEAFGFELASGRGGSHRTFRHAKIDHVTVPDPGKGTIRAVYVEQVIAAIDRLGEAVDEDS